jgi:hypothetical protein
MAVVDSGKRIPIEAWAKDDVPPFRGCAISWKNDGDFVRHWQVIPLLVLARHNA